MPQLSPVTGGKSFGINWRSLCKVGGISALIAGVLFRRNIAAEISLFTHSAAPATVNGWFELLQSNRFLGLIYLNIFDLMNYMLVGLMMLALYAVLGRAKRSCMAIALALGLIGVTVYLASNTAFSMLSLSNQYASYDFTAVQKNLLLSAGQAMLAFVRFGTGGYISVLLVAIAGMMISIVMLKTNMFSRATGYVGIVAAALDLIYCIAFLFVPYESLELLSVCFIPAAGLLLMIWHIMVGWKLCRIGCSKEIFTDAMIPEKDFT